MRAAMTAYPTPSRDAATVLGEALRRIGYCEDGVVELLGEDAFPPGREDIPVALRRLPDTPLAAVVRAVLLQRPVPRTALVEALGEEAVAALGAIGIGETLDDGTVVLRGRILPVGDLLMASDDFPAAETGKEEPDYVAAFTPTSQILDALTPRRRVRRALDVGSGSGVQALFAARHADSVVATDLNERALAFVDLNAALNGFRNIETRSGSLFEPVAGERFDLITCNAPYVVSPERRWLYRDSGFNADEVSEKVVAAAAEHLELDGFATLLVSWVAEDEDSRDEHPLDWTDELDCDDWILPIWESDALSHAATWNDHLEGEPKAAALDEWTEYLDGLGVDWVTEGAIVLHRRNGGGPHTTRIDEIDEDIGDASEQVERAFAARARLAELDDDALLRATLTIAAPLRVEQELEPGRGGRTTVTDATVTLDEGTQSTIETTARAPELLALLDGRTPLGETIDRLAIPRDDALALVETLLELGALRFS
jgi:methylase of polypeptide subunit release factors